MSPMSALLAFGVLSLLAAGPAASGVSFQKGTDRIDVLFDGAPFTTYNFASSLPRPFFYPLRAADGTKITRAYPMEKTDAEAAAKDLDHPHHRSFWFTHGDVDGVDYWGEAGKRPGKIV